MLIEFNYRTQMKKPAFFVVLQVVTQISVNVNLAACTELGTTKMEMSQKNPNKPYPKGKYFVFFNSLFMCGQSFRRRIAFRSYYQIYSVGEFSF